MRSISPSIIDIRRTRHENTIPNMVIEGLTQTPKTFPALLFYSSEGIEHWINHSHAADFYPRAEELRILEAEAASIAASIASHSVVVDLGSASAEKIVHILKAVEAQQKHIQFYALDLSDSALLSTIQEIQPEQFHYVQIAALYGTFDDGFHWLQNAPQARGHPHCLLMLGLTIGNYSRANAAKFIRTMAREGLAASCKQSSIILTIDSCKDENKVLRAYRADGVVPFAMASLPYANRLFGCQEKRVFREEDWEFDSFWNRSLGRHEASLVMRSSDTKLGSPLDMISMKKGEKVRFGCSHKYDKREREELIQSAGLKEVTSWSSSGCDVGFYQLKLA
ncbi:unnamed protein product [Penicillium olsonii]|nr:unnamed protein product [Penicillium olsonii]